MATRASGYRIDPLGRYYTPAWPVASLLAAYPRFFDVDCYWDPCAGAGHILAALEAHWPAEANRFHGSDIAPPKQRVWAGEIARQDARKAVKPWPQVRTAIVTNPPYGHQGRLAQEIIQHLLAIAGPQDIIAVLLSAGFDSRSSRADLFGNRHFVRRIQLTERIRWANLKQMRAGPSQAHVWCVWDRRRRGPARVVYVGKGMSDAPTDAGSAHPIAAAAV